MNRSFEGGVEKNFAIVYTTSDNSMVRAVSFIHWLFAERVPVFYYRSPFANRFEMYEQYDNR